MTTQRFMWLSYDARWKIQHVRAVVGLLMWEIGRQLGHYGDHPRPQVVDRGTPSRVDKRVAPDNEGAADKQCQGEGKLWSQYMWSQTAREARGNHLDYFPRQDIHYDIQNMLYSRRLKRERERRVRAVFVWRTTLMLWWTVNTPMLLTGRVPVLMTTLWCVWLCRGVRWTWCRSNRNSNVSLAPRSTPWSRSEQVSLTFTLQLTEVWLGKLFTPLFLCHKAIYLGTGKSWGINRHTTWSTIPYPWSRSIAGVWLRAIEMKISAVLEAHPVGLGTTLHYVVYGRGLIDHAAPATFVQPLKTFIVVDPVA